MSKSVCYKCGSETSVHELYGFFICGDCESKLNLMTDQTVNKHLTSRSDYAKGVEDKLQMLEKDYAGKKIRLLHIRDRIKKIRS